MLSLPFRRDRRALAVPGRWINRRHAGPDGTRYYDIYLPVGLTRRERVPMLLLLHGCGQSSMEFADQTGFTTAADSARFVVVAPRQEFRHHIQRCWRWFDSSHQNRGAGEPAILNGIVQQVRSESKDWRIDRRRVYVAGLSAGGAMALILATTYPDVFAAAGVHSATAYRSATQSFRALGAMAAHGDAPPHGILDGEMAPVVLIHGTSDRVVRPPNADRIVDQWLASRDESRTHKMNRIRPLATTRALIVDGRRCIRTRWYTATGRRVLEYWRIDGLGHAWSGGEMSGSYIDPRGPGAADVMWTFFNRHHLTNGWDDPGLPESSW